AATAAKSRRLSLSSFPAIAGKGDRAVRGGRGAGLAEFSFNEDETSSQKPPPPPCVRYAHYGRSPSPAIAGAEGKRRRSRGAFLFAPESSAHYFQKRRRQPTFVRCPRQWNGRTHHDRSGARRFVGWAKARNAPCPRVSQNAFLKTVFLKTAWASLRSAHPTKRTKTKGSRTPTDAGLPASPSGEARTLARARSPVGVPLRLSPGRQLVPKAQRQAMLSGTVRNVRSCTAAPTGERRPCASPCMIRKSGCRFSGKIMH